MNVNMPIGNMGIGSRYSLLTGGMMKSTQEKMARKQECDNKVAFYENQLASLKEMKGTSLDEISRKLEMFHTYQDCIAAAKHEYNNSQMFHVMDEALERAEKIAEAADDMKPKTAEERREEMAEEARGTEEEKGMLTEIMDELTELAEELTEKLSEEVLEKAEEAVEELGTHEKAEEVTEALGMSEKSTEALNAAKKAEATEASSENTETPTENLSDELKDIKAASGKNAYEIYLDITQQERDGKHIYKSVNYYV